MTRKLGAIALVLFVLTVWAANFAVEHFGLVSVGFGLMAPAGVYFAGLAFGLRDAVQRTLGRWAVVGAILAGAALSLFVSERLAIASATAFLVSETADFLVYTPLARHSLSAAVAISNTVGAVIDSLIFLWLAFGSLAFLQGQVVGKLWMTLPALAVVAVVNARVPAGERAA